MIRHVHLYDSCVLVVNRSYFSSVGVELLSLTIIIIILVIDGAPLGEISKPGHDGVHRLKSLLFLL